MCKAPKSYTRPVILSRCESCLVVIGGLLVATVALSSIGIFIETLVSLCWARVQLLGDLNWISCGVRLSMGIFPHGYNSTE